MGAEPRARHVNFDWMEPARQLHVNVNQEQARQLGISSAALAGTLNAAVTGTTVTQVRDDIYLVNVVARAIDDERASFESLSSLQVPTPGGRMVPLRQFATFSEEQEFPLIWRRDRVPTLTVRADVSPRRAARHGGRRAWRPTIAEFAAKLPTQYKIDTGGLYEESAVSSASVFAVVPLMIVLMLIIMMVMLVSFRRLAMVVGIMPLGLIGVVLSLLVFNRPLGFVAILGVLALIGMIAKNAVILIVQIETDRAEGKGVYEAVIASATSRMRPMMLAAMSTILGLLPIAPTVFWGPMAFAIMGGLLVATMLTLVLLPTVYVAVFGKRDNARADAGSSTCGRGQVDRTWPPTCSRSTSPTSGGCSIRWTPPRSTSGTSIRRRPTTSWNGPEELPGKGPLALVVKLGTPTRRRRQRRSRRASRSAITSSAGQQRLAVTCATCCGWGATACSPPCCSSDLSSSLPSRPRSMVQTERYARVDREQPGHRRLGRAVASARDLPVRLVADPRRGQAVRPAEPDGRAHGRCRAGRRRHRRVAGVSTGPAPAPDANSESPRSAALWRGVAFFLLWMLLMQSMKPADLAVGALASVGATWISLRLMPPASGCLHFGQLFALLPHFLWESVLAGIDVARRALHPRLPLSPGFVSCPLSFPPGLARNTFATITSLLPGSVSAGESEGELVYHCLDDTSPVVEQLWKEERLLARALVAGRRHG